jgi:hypothetical protein
MLWYAAGIRRRRQGAFLGWRSVIAVLRLYREVLAYENMNPIRVH